MGMQSLVLMTPSQVARMLDVSADTVRAWADGGQLECLRTTAGHRLFLREEVERFARERAARRPPGGGTAAPPTERIDLTKLVE